MVVKEVVVAASNLQCQRLRRHYDAEPWSVLCACGECVWCVRVVCACGVCVVFVKPVQWHDVAFLLLLPVTLLYTNKQIWTLCIMLHCCIAVLLCAP